MDYDVAIIGAGTGGYVAAIKAAQMGKKVAIIEKRDLGGVCLNRGCIPTKTLLKSAEKWQEVTHCSDFGIFVSEAAYDWEKIKNRKDDVIHQLRSGIEKLLDANKVTMLVGEATIKDAHNIHIQPDNPDGFMDISAENIIIATGSSPAKPPIPGIKTLGVITSDDLLKLDEVPQSLLIVGAGVIGLEFAGIYAGFGCQVTVVEMTPSILPPSDIDMQRRMNVALRKQFITVKTNAAVKEIKTGAEGLNVSVESRGKTEVLTAEKVLIATGRTPNINQDELNKLGVAFTRKGITVNEKMETSVPGIYAIGDVTGMSMLAHSAAHMGIVAAENICGTEAKMDYSAIPSCIFTTPEIAAVGLTEQECKAQNLDVKISKFNFAGNGKALTMGETDGLVKLIADAKTHKIVGCHIMGAHASDLIMEGTLAVQQGLTAEQVATTIHPHPTLSEAVDEAALGLFGQMIHQVTIKR
jgi:dihydrolipoamide dehydrogenase